MEKFKQALSTEMIHDFRTFLLETFGLNFFGKRDKDLERAIENTATYFFFTDSITFVRWALDIKHTDVELGKIAENFTVGETYFFREKKALDFLEQMYLPGLVFKRRGLNRKLKIWSAGCAGGEEAYTIAILLHRLIPDLKHWDITILATDINTVSLDKAKKGIYTKWSFRNQPDWLIQDYFIQRGSNEFEIIPEIKKMVQFSFLNLAEESYPSQENNTMAMDVVFCRNVLIYFSQEGNRVVSSRLYHTLQMGGVLLVSPVEMSYLITSEFDKIHFAGLTIYQKGSTEKIKPVTVRPVLSPPLEITKKVPEILIPRKETIHIIPNETAFEKSVKLFEKGLYQEAETLLISLLTQKGVPLREAMKLLVKTKANLGKLEEAIHLCEEALLTDSTNESLYYLKATILMEEGRDEAAFAALNRALYLKPDFVLAHFLMGAICFKLNKETEGSKHFKNTSIILSKMDGSACIPESEGITVEVFLKMIDTIKKP